MSRIAIVINPNSGNSSKERHISKLLENKNLYQFSIIHFDNRNIKSFISDLASQGYDTIIAAGGDGTVSSIAGVIVELDLKVKFGVLPTGTFNHFAKDIGMPQDIETALEVIAKGKSTYIDIGKVNHMYFLNNSSLGLYPKLVKYRQNYQKKGLWKWFAFGASMFALFRSDTSFHVEFESGQHKKIKRTPFVFVGNNKYEMEGFSAGARKNLDQGILSLCIAMEVTKLRLTSFVFHAIKGSLIQQKDFNIIGVQEFTINSRKRFLHVSHDGEVSSMQTPLQYKILPKVLWVIIP